MNDFRVEVKIKNAVLYNLITSHNPTVNNFAKEHKMSATSLGEFINMKNSPINKYGNWKPSVLKLADFFNVHPSYIFPDTIANIELTTNKGSFEVDKERVKEIMNVHQDPILEIENDDLKKSISRLLDNIPKFKIHEHGIDIVKKHFGLEDYDPKNFVEISEDYDISSSRVTQIFNNTMRIIRQPCNVGEIFLFQEGM